MRVVEVLSGAPSQYDGAPVQLENADAWAINASPANLQFRVLVVVYSTMYERRNDRIFWLLLETERSVKSPFRSLPTTCTIDLKSLTLSPRAAAPAISALVAW
jgi:hypothetical protein